MSYQINNAKHLLKVGLANVTSDFYKNIFQEVTLKHTIEVLYQFFCCWSIMILLPVKSSPVCTSKLLVETVTSSSKDKIIINSKIN
jgi:hypothetical protein